MIKSPSEFLIEQVSSPEDLNTLQLIDSCYTALSEGVNDSFVINTTKSSTYKFLDELLDRIFKFLTDLYVQVLNYMNNYFMNSARLLDKYRNIIMTRYAKDKTNLIYKTHTYPGLYDKNYPNIVSASDIQESLEAFQNQITDEFVTSDTVAEKTEMYVSKFAVDTIGARIDPFDLKVQVEKVVRKKCQGMEVVKSLSASDLDTMINEIAKYKPMKDAILATKKSMTSEYKSLKSAMLNEMRQKTAEKIGINNITNPDAADLVNAEYTRFAAINMSLTQMYNAFITIYNIAYTTKLKVLAEKIDENRQVINDLLVKTSVFAAANPTKPRAYRAPQKFEPKI
nr:MAG TPA: hypothetical protein [Caudoviricetes sp.]